MISIMTTDDEITVTVNGHVTAKFDDSGNGMEGEIFEGDNSRMTASCLIQVAKFLLSKAADRADDEYDK